MAKNNFCLENKISVQHFQLIDVTDFKIQEKTERSNGSDWIGTGEYEAFLNIDTSNEENSFELFIDNNLELYIDIEEEFISSKLVDFAKNVISNVVEMDVAARSIDLGHDWEEKLVGVSICQSRVSFSYWAEHVNTDWNVIFKYLNGNDWTFLGIPDPNNPGKYVS